MTIKVHQSAKPPIHSNGSPNPALTKLKSQRQHDKNRLITLNQKLEEYLERVKHLEAENNSLIDLIVDMKQRILTNTMTIKSDYEFPLNILKNSLNAEAGNEVVAKLKLRRLNYLVQLMKTQLKEAEAQSRENTHKIEKLNALNENLKSEKEFLIEQIDHSSNDLLKNKLKIEELLTKLTQLNDRLDQQTFERIEYQLGTRRLMEDIGFNRSIHDSFKLELGKLNSEQILNDSNYYKQELEKTIRAIREDYRRMLDENKSEMADFYNQNLEKMESEYQSRIELTNQEKKYSNEVGILKNFRTNFTDDLSKLKSLNSNLEKRFHEVSGKLEDIRAENQQAIEERNDLIKDLKLYLRDQLDTLSILKSGKLPTSSVDTELKIYKSLLNIGKNDGPSKVITEPPIYVYDTKVKNLKEIKGPVGIREVSLDSKCIVIENMSDSNAFDLSGWYLERILDNKGNQLKVTLPDGAVVEKKARLNLWSGNFDNVEENFRSDIIYRHVKDWGKGDVLVTRLYDRNGDLKSTHSQNIIY